MFWTTWNTESNEPSVLTSSDYVYNYEDAMISGLDFFLGFKLNANNQIEKAFACGIYSNITPVCIEGYPGGNKYEANKKLLQDTRLWDNYCSIETYEEGTNSEYEQIRCQSPGEVLTAYSLSSGLVTVGDIYYDSCTVSSNGYVSCRAGGD